MLLQNVPLQLHMITKYTIAPKESEGWGRGGGDREGEDDHL